MEISIVIPAYNESQRIERSLELIKAYIEAHPENRFEVIISEDCSKDSTLEIIKKINWVKVVSHTPNRGKGFTLREGVRVAQYQYIYLCDADLSTPIDELELFLNAIQSADCVIGSRALAQSNATKTKWYRKLLGRAGNLMIRIVLGLSFNDTQCGFKMMTQDCKPYFLKTTINRWGIDFEFLYLLRKAKLKVKEIPVSWVATADTRVQALDYFKTLGELVKIWWDYNIARKYR